MATVIDRLTVALGLDPSGFQKGRQDSKAALDGLRRDVEATQEAIAAIEARAAREKQQGAAEERAIAREIGRTKRETVDATSAEHVRTVKALRADLEAKKAANRERQKLTAEELAEQKDILDEKQQAFKETEKQGRDQTNTSRKRVQATRDEGTAVQALTTKVIGLFAAFTAGKGVGAFIKDGIANAAALGRVAANLGVDIEALGAWQGAVERTGGSAEAATNAIQGLVTAREAMRANQMPEGAAILGSLRMTVQDLDDPIAAMEKLADVAQTMSRPQFAYRAGLLGIDPGVINTLIQGGDAVRKLMEDTRRAGVITEEQARQSALADMALKDLQRSAEMLGNSLLFRALPAIEKVTEWLRQLTQWAKDNPQAVEMAVAGLAVAVGALGAVTLAPLIAGLASATFYLAPILALGAGIAWLVSDFAEFEKTGKSAVDWGAFIPVWERLKTAVSEVVGACEALIAAIPQSWWDDAAANARFLADILEAYVLANLKLLAAQLGIVGDAITAVGDILRGDWGPAWKGAAETVLSFVGTVLNPLETVLDTVREIGVALGLIDERKPDAAGAAGGAWGGPASPYMPGGGSSTGGSAVDQAHALIRQFEGFRSSAYWDVNAYRAGYGSDTLTDPTTGRVTRVTKGTRGVTKEMAEADLKRRVANDFIPAARNAIGDAKWAALSDAAKAAITSVTYNYGSTPRSVVTAARTGDANAVSAAIAGLSRHNNSVNADRRRAEAAFATSSSARTPTPAPAPRMAANDAWGGPSRPYMPAGASQPPAVARAPAATPAPPAVARAPAATPAPPAVAIVATGGAGEQPLGGAASALLSAASALMAAATALRGSGGRGAVAPSSYDRGLNVGAAGSYNRQAIANDNSRRVEASTSIGSITVQAGGNADNIVSGLARALKARSLAYNAASGLS